MATAWFEEFLDARPRPQPLSKAAACVTCAAPHGHTTSPVAHRAVAAALNNSLEHHAQAGHPEQAAAFTAALLDSWLQICAQRGAVVGRCDSCQTALAEAQIASETATGARRPSPPPSPAPCAQTTAGTVHYRAALRLTALGRVCRGGASFSGGRRPRRSTREPPHQHA
jgi:hypothetical protein